MFLFAVAHPVDVVAHPSIPAGWRWAVYDDDTDWSSMSACLGAGWAPEQGAAAWIADQAAAIAASAVAISVGGERSPNRPTVRSVVLDHDPIRVGNDFVRVG